MKCYLNILCGNRKWLKKIMFSVFIQHNLHFGVNSHFMKFYETVLFMSRCSPSLVLTKQQQLWPTPFKSKEEVKWFSWLAGQLYMQDTLIRPIFWPG